MRRISFPLVLVLSVAVGCGDSESARDPYVAAPVADGVVGATTFVQRVANQDTDPALFPDAANYWDLQPDLSLSDGFDDQFDGAHRLFVGTLATTPATWDSLHAETTALDDFPYDQVHSEVAFYEPTFGAADLKLAGVMDTNQTYWAPLAGTYSAYLAPTGDSRLQQAVNLAAATGTVTLSWLDNASAYERLPGSVPYFRVVIRSATTGEILATALTGTSASGAHSFDLTAYAGQSVVLSFEYRSASGLGRVDGVSITDGDATEFVNNGDFETGDLTGWTVATDGQSQNLVGGVRTVGGLEVTRGVYTAPNLLWARWVDVFENIGGTPVTTDVVYRTNLGSDYAGIVYDTPGAAGRAISSWDGYMSDRDVAIAYGTGQAFYMSDPTLGAGDGNDYVYVLHTITVPAGGSVALVHFFLMNGVNTGETALDIYARATAMDAAAAAVATGVGVDLAYLDWMTAGQREATIANW